MPTLTGRTPAEDATIAPSADLVGDVEVELTLLGRHAMHSSQHTEDRQLDRSGYHLLGRLERTPLSLKQLAEAFRLDQSTVNRQVNALQKAGHVERIADPDGGTALLIRPTTAGRRAKRSAGSTSACQTRAVSGPTPGTDWWSRNRSSSTSCCACFS